MMRWAIVFFLSAGLLVSQLATAESDTCADSEAGCVLQAAWSATLLLPEDKHARLGPMFLELAVLSGEADLMAQWQERLALDPEDLPSQTYPDYGWQQAEPVLLMHGVDGLIRQAQAREGDLGVGRADALLAAGRHLIDERPDAAKQINTALLEMTGSASEFEQPILAHAAAELAMLRCDARLLDAARRQTLQPESLRYRFWQARIRGGVKGLLASLRAGPQDEDTRFVRQALDGYRAILELGYCQAAGEEIGS